MITIKLQGGLGNQMFQYALGRKLELKKSKKIKYDFSFFAHKGNRPYELDRLGLQLQQANKIEMLSAPSSGNVLMDKVKKIYRSLFQVAHLKQETFAFDERFLNAPDRAYLEGYWQTEKYFFDIRSELIKEINFREPLNEKAKKAEGLIKTTNSVSLHFRRGDYIADPANIFKICDWSYYENAIEIIAEKIPDPHFFIFSDDPNWCRQNIRLDHLFKIVDANDTESNNHLDMYLMSLCKHNIIANSSFSWWAAWLNQNDEKLVVAPKDWFADKTIETKDVIPENWISI